MVHGSNGTNSPSTTTTPSARAKAGKVGKDQLVYNQARSLSVDEWKACKNKGNYDEFEDVFTIVPTPDAATLAEIRALNTSTRNGILPDANPSPQGPQGPKGTTDACQWTVRGRRSLGWDERAPQRDWFRWLEWIVTQILAPRGYAVYGEMLLYNDGVPTEVYARGTHVGTSVYEFEGGTGFDVEVKGTLPPRPLAASAPRTKLRTLMTALKEMKNVTRASVTSLVAEYDE